MNKGFTKIGALAIAALIGAWSVVPQGTVAENAYASEETKPTPSPEACTLPLYEKDARWTVVAEGAHGLLRYDYQGFTFEASGLNPDTDYSLIYAPDPWPQGIGTSQADGSANGNTVLASGTSDGGGNIALAGSYDFSTLPNPNDANYPGGAKIWLVLSADHDGEQMTAWHQPEYLYEGYLFTPDEECLTTPEEPTPTPTPERPLTPAGAPMCPNGVPAVVPANPHVVRNGSVATVNAHIPEGDHVNIYYRENSEDGWTHAARDIPVTGNWLSYDIQDLDPNTGYTFGIQSANGCAGGETVLAVIIDPPANGVVFPFSYWEWLN